MINNEPLIDRVMKLNRKLKYLSLTMILCMSAWGILDSSMAEEPATNNYISSTKDGWTIHDSELLGRSLSWAGYNESCVDGPFTLKFKLKSLQREMHANINIKDSNRYAIGFINEGNTSLSTYLFKQSSGVQPTPGKYFLGRSISYDRNREYEVKIVSKDGRIQVFVYEAGGEQELMPVIDYHDPDPLPQGRIDFETLDGTLAQLNDIALICSSPSYVGEDRRPSSTNKEPPNLGIGYFKPP
jgi:hypothetical protein